MNQELHGKKVLVTGGAGFIGSHLCDALLLLGCQVVAMDKQGRVLLPQLLRESAGMVGEVSVLGLQNHLAVWNQKRLFERLFKKEPFTEDDGKALSEFGI